MGGLLKGVTRALGLGDDSGRGAEEMRRQAEAQAAQLRQQAAEQQAQLRQNAAMQQQQQEAMARQIAAQEQARRLEEKAAREQEVVETGPAPSDEQADMEEEARRRNPRAQYMAPTGAYTGISLQI